MNILAIDTSSQISGLALQTGDRVYVRVAETGRSHSREILPSIEGLLAESGLVVSDLDLLVFANGPGSFTGIRITVGVVQGLAFSLGIPVVPVSNLACLAQQAYRVHGIEKSLVAINARKDELFHGAFVVSDGVVKPAGSEALHRASQFPVPAAGDWYGIGDGWLIRSEIEAAIGMTVTAVHTDFSSHPEDILAIGRRRFDQEGGLSATHAQPEYLREQVASPR